jgi:type IV pilus assembly protein PilQ
MNKIRILILGLIVFLFCFAQAGADITDTAMDLSFLPQENFSMELADADVKNIIHIIGVTYDINFLVNASVTGTMTVNFKNVPIRDAFKSIMKNFELNFTRDGNIIRIDNFNGLEAKKVNSPLITRPIHVKYTFDSTESISGKGAGQGLSELAKSMEELLSGKEGSGISVIPRTNTLLVTDILSSVIRIEKLIRELDKKSKQIRIMARIIEANVGFAQEMGVSWGGVIEGKNKNEFVITGGANSDGVNDGAIPREGLTFRGANMVQNAAVLVGQSAALAAPGGASIDFLIGNMASNFLDLQLSAMERDNNGKILASPKVITQNNMVATIKSGFQVPIQTIEQGTVTVQYKDALIRLEALPHIIDDNIFLDLKVIKDDVDDSRNVQGNPFLSNKEITTKVLVNNGETVVIGGLITQEEVDITKGIPYISRIPLLGWLFRFEQHINKKTELLIFVTPSILKDA